MEDVCRKTELLQILEKLTPQLQKESDRVQAFALVKKDFDARTADLEKAARKVGTQLSNVFRFCEEVFAEGQEILILVTELTIQPHTARFISLYGCPEYFAHSKELLFYERQQDIINELERLDLDK